MSFNSYLISSFPGYSGGLSGRFCFLTVYPHQLSSGTHTIFPSLALLLNFRDKELVQVSSKNVLKLYFFSWRLCLDENNSPSFRVYTDKYLWFGYGSCLVNGS